MGENLEVIKLIEAENRKAVGKTWERVGWAQRSSLEIQSVLEMGCTVLDVNAALSAMHAFKIMNKLTQILLQII